MLGANVVFAIDGLCFLFVILALLRWRRPIEPSHRAPVENFFESFASAIRYVRLTPAIRVVVLRGALFGLFIAVIPALVPVVGLKKLYLGVSHFGLLLTSKAIGSVLGAVFVVPRVRARFYSKCRHDPGMRDVRFSLLPHRVHQSILGERESWDEVRRLHHAQGAPEIRHYISRGYEILSREDET
jgi:hypothetical protein